MDRIALYHYVCDKPELRDHPKIKAVRAELDRMRSQFGKAAANAYLYGGPPPTYMYGLHVWRLD